MTHLDRSIAVRRGRWAVAAAFFVNGFLLGGWALQIPSLMSRLAIGETTLGLLILVLGLGALVAMPWCGFLIGRIGSRPVLLALAFAATPGLLLVALLPHVAVAVPALFLFGAVVGGMDVAMNANAVSAERQLGRPIMSSSHGFWSLGGFAGAASGGLVIQQFGNLAHAGAASLVAFVVVALAARHVVEGDRPVETGRQKLRLPSNPLIYLIGVIALLSMIPEGTVLDWGALYLKQELGADIAVAGLGFAAFSATMAVMRFVGDGIRGRFGAVATLRVSSLVAALGMAGAGFAPGPAIAILAMAVAGLGIANMVPIAFSAAGNQPGMVAGTGIGIVTTMGYSGILVAPSLIGFVGEHFGFAPIFAVLAVLLCIVAMSARLARSADFSASLDKG
ncbi:MFS transporter [Chelativorans sp. ZYF759]|uniref:MFS transporter n=1 Tax=Chelativorans sp. ZYF759 TaxID=2692213 RepID=UPI0016B22680|nr:MFS transporter [Chelativorans sp. ZYF759]NMG38021.1 MFS transporter [Chelativorans sp. ZYF759]